MTSSQQIHPHPYSGYAQSLYYLLTNTFVDNLDLSLIDEYFAIERSIGSDEIKSSDENKSDKEIYIYPNPASSIINVENWKEIKKMNIYNSLGESVINFNGKSSINTEKFSNGIYWVKFESKDGSEAIEKLIIAK